MHDTAARCIGKKIAAGDAGWISAAGFEDVAALQADLARALAAYFAISQRPPMVNCSVTARSETVSAMRGAARGAAGGVADITLSAKETQQMKKAIGGGSDADAAHLRTLLKKALDAAVFTKMLEQGLNRGTLQRR